MPDDVLFGKLIGQSQLSRGERPIRLTPAPAAVPGGADLPPLLPALDLEGAFGVFRGDLVDGTLHRAEVVEIIPPILSEVLDRLLTQGTLDDETLRPLVGHALADLVGPEPMALADADSLPRCALVVGHRPGDRGAVSGDGLTEFDFNLALSGEIRQRVGGADVEVVLRDDTGDGLSRLPAKVNALSPRFVVSLHCNSFTNPAVSGTECLYLDGSSPGHRLAKLVQRHLVAALGLRNRHTKPRTAAERGGLLLSKTAAPTVIAEPFFLSNPHDVERALERRSALIAAYADAIDEAAAIF